MFEKNYIVWKDLGKYSEIACIVGLRRTIQYGKKNEMEKEIEKEQEV